MHYTFKTFNVGAGDCIALLLQNGDEEIHIMVDCGCFTSDVKNYVVQKFAKRIDFLIVTHIDNDHINGIIAMLSDMDDLTINHILFNCYQRTSEHLDEWDEKMVENVKRQYGFLPEVLDLVGGKINAEASKTLAEIILRNESWKNAWRREYVTSESPYIELGQNMGKFVFISPDQEALDRLDFQYRKLFWQKLYKKKDSDYKEEETIYEALMRIADKETTCEEEQTVSATTLTADVLQNYADERLSPLTDSNEASIAFVWEFEGHKILFCGDASPATISKRIKELYSDLTKPILFDVIKVSHHGSAHSTSKELISVADSKMYFITGGAKERPSYQALSRIVTAVLPDGLDHREIRYNRQNDILMTFEKSNELKDFFHFSISNNSNEYELSY